MKRSIFLFALCALALLGCEDKQPYVNTDKEDNSIPYWWSPAGHIYIYEQTWEGSPADDRYWVWVLDFFSNDSVVKYQTPNRDFTYHDDFMGLVDSTRWERKDNSTILYYTLSNGSASEMLIIDTTTIYWKSMDITYSIIHN